MQRFGLEDYRRFLGNIHVEQPIAADDPFYVDLGEGRGGSAARRLTGAIVGARRGEYTHQLLSGFPGSGKSTELLVLESRLRGRGYEPIYLDVDQFVSKSKPLEPGDILLAIGAALFDAGRAVSPFQQIAARLKALLLTRVHVSETDLKAGVPGAEASLKVVFEKHTDLFGEFRRVLEQEDLGLFHAVQTMVADLQQGREGRVVLLVDSLEHTLTLSNRVLQDSETLRRTMIEDAQLRELPIHCVFTVSPLLLPYADAVGRVYNNDLLIVPAVGVLGRDGEENSEAVTTLVEVLRRRVDLALFARGEDDVRTAVRASGGYLRDLFRIVRSALYTVDFDDFGAIPTVALEKEIDRMASATAAALTIETSAVLRQVVEHPGQLLPSEADRPLLFSLYREPLLLRYMNGGAYDVAHPLVVRTLQRDLYERRVFPGGRQGPL